MIFKLKYKIANESPQISTSDMTWISTCIQISDTDSSLTYDANSNSLSIFPLFGHQIPIGGQRLNLQIIFTYCLEISMEKALFLFSISGNFMFHI